MTSDPPGPRFVGGRTQTNVCGVCGHIGRQTRAHVPPQAAGNTGEVRRYRPAIVDGALASHREPQRGGLFIESLCRDCNSQAGSRYDRAYADFARRVSFVRAGKLALPGPVPPVSLAPGLVSRSILMGLLAVNPRIRELHPALTHQLLDDAPEIRLPGGLQLRLALTAQRAARLAAATMAMKVLESRLIYFTLAEVWFRPFAWALTPTPGASPPQLGPDLILQEGWADVTEWLRFSVERTTVDLRDIVRSLPTVSHPLGQGHQNWIEMSGQGPRLEGFIP